MDNIFLFTEIAHCGKIGRIALKSFFTHHKTKVHVFGTKADFEWIREFEKLIVWHDVDKEFWPYLTVSRTPPFIAIHSFSDHFYQGHWGTAHLWARLIKSRPEKYFVHFDSDVVFQKEALSDITSAFKKEFDLVGPIRNYKYNRNNRDDVRDLPDITQTVFFGFNKDKISYHSLSELVKMCRGSFNPLGHPVIDFFDPVAFDILANGGKIKLLGSKEYGGLTRKGEMSKHSPLNNYIGYGIKLIHFAGVGSGLNYYSNPSKIHHVPQTYKDFALERYALFAKLFYNEDCALAYDKQVYKALKKDLSL